MICCRLNVQISLCSGGATLVEFTVLVRIRRPGRAKQKFQVKSYQYPPGLIDESSLIKNEQS